MAEKIIDRKGLTSKEVMAMSMALSMMIEYIEGALKNQLMPFTPQARMDMNDMLSNAKSAKEKIDSTSGHEVVIAPYVTGDEDEFLTKES